MLVRICSNVQEFLLSPLGCCKEKRETLGWVGEAVKHMAEEEERLFQ